MKSERTSDLLALQLCDLPADQEMGIAPALFPE